MPAQKRSRETLQKEDALLQQQLDHTNSSNSHEQKQQPQGDTGDDGGGRADEQSDRSQSSSSINEDVKEEYVVVKLSEIRKEVQCPICLGIIRKTRTVMECLHRFCRECIDKSMRLGALLAAHIVPVVGL
uniref:RING-type domain-containing protein n=1 Tax=Salix viminalis TaxID=40686 RepID=A0A6N2KYK0_SALVM